MTALDPLSRWETRFNFYAPGEIISVDPATVERPRPRPAIIPGWFAPPEASAPQPKRTPDGLRYANPKPAPRPVKPKAKAKPKTKPRKERRRPDREAIVALHVAGKHVREIAAETGWTVCTVNRILRGKHTWKVPNKGKPPMHWPAYTPEELKRVADARLAGMTVYAIAQQEHCSRERINRMLQQSGVDTSGVKTIRKVTFRDGKLYCPRGHERSPEVRECRECERLMQREWKAAKRQKAAVQLPLAGMEVSVCASVAAGGDQSR